jgi:hypothetical protein
MTGEFPNKLSDKQYAKSITNGNDNKAQLQCQHLIGSKPEERDIDKSYKWLDAICIMNPIGSQSVALCNMITNGKNVKGIVIIWPGTDTPIRSKS